MCAAAPVATSGTAYTPSTVTGPSASLLSSSAGIVAVHVPSAASVASTGVVVAWPSVAVTATPVVRNWELPETLRSVPASPVAAVTLFWPNAEIGLQPAMGPLKSPSDSASAGTFRLGPPLTLTVSPARMSGVRPTPPGSDRAPFCQQSPPGSKGVGVVVFTVNGSVGNAKPAN